MIGRYWKAVRALAVLLLAMACSSPVPSPLSPTAGPTTVTSQAPAGTPAPSGQSSEQAGLRLNEVRFAPLAGEPGFVEVANTGAGPIDVAGVALRLTDRDLQLTNAPILPAGGLLLVLLDGLDSVEGSVIHGPSGLNLPPDRGSVELLALDGTALDRIAWGDTDPQAVPTGPGGIVPDGFTAGSTIARAAGASTPGAPLEWIVSAAATPGNANPAPSVSVMLPLSGAILDPGAADLFWYPVPGASSYRVQVATEPAFTSPVMDITGSEAQVSVANLAPGAYFWRIQTIPADGTESRFSEPADFELAAAGTARARASALEGTAPHARTRLAGVAVDTPGRHLTVPVIGQHKDTAMLLLERNVETGAHPWDADHHSLDPNDPADNKNCALAMIAMVSAFYGGGLSQDRIGYEVISHRAGNPRGPEGDLMYGYGTDGVEAWEAFKWALGDVTVPGLMTFEDMWNIVVREIDAGRPVGAANSHHGFAITGYEVTGGRRLITVNDPWPGRTYRQDIDRIGLAASDFNFFLMPANPNVRHQEISVTTDSDGDGVVDFDETERFGTNPNDADGDADGLPDKQDIVTGVFDPRYGYATTGRNPFGRDYDSDGTPTERDRDSDEGGCLDGEEDANGNGHRDQSERYNFDGDDDECTSDKIVLQGTIRGTGTDTPNYVNTIPDRTTGRIEVTMEVTITITTQPDDWTSTGTATVSGEYTGDCEFSDSDSGQMTRAGMHIFDSADPTDMIAYVEVFASDPRYTQRPLTGLYLNVFARTAGRGGTCRHTLGPVEDAYPPLQVSLSGCSFFEILNNNGTWHGECSQASDINPGTGQPYDEQHWTANLEQISPRETPP